VAAGTTYAWDKGCDDTRQQVSKRYVGDLAHGRNDVPSMWRVGVRSLPVLFGQ
jgi:hypothetical protein